MNIAYFDCFSGIAGDMTLGALLDCGVPLEKVREGLKSLNVEGWQIEAQPVLKNGIHALQVEISLHGETDADELRRQLEQRQSAEGSRQEAAHAHSHDEHSHDHSDEHNRLHSHEHSHHEHSQDHHAHEDSVEHGHSHSHVEDSHHHAHSHDHEHSHTHSHEEHAHSHGRSMAEIRALIEASALSDKVKATSLKIFGEIARAEAKIHHATPDDVHFHEIGGVDSLIDICGVAWCLDYLEVEEVYCSALPHSSGHVHCAHGIMPVPAPATLEMLRGAPFFPTVLKGETTTPTGAGIIAALNNGFGSPPAFTPRLIGNGAGHKNWDDRPNILRITIGEKAKTATSSTRLGGLQSQTLALLETNIDDMNPELWDHVLERLFAQGALDAWLQPIQMKKNRPATTFSVLCELAARDAILATILRETTTLGVRVREVERLSMPRTHESVATHWGEVRVKVARWNEEKIERAAPEYDDVARLSREHNVAAREIYIAAQNVFGK